MRNTFNINYYCRQSKAKNGLAPIEVSILIKGERCFIQLPRKESPEAFKKAMASKRSNEIKEYIDEVRNKFNKIELEMMRNGIDITATNLKNCWVNGFKKYLIRDLFNEFLTMTHKRVGTNLTEAAYQKYEYVRNLFYTQVSPDIEVSNITCSMIENFYIYLQTKYNNATAASHMTRLKTIITFAMDDGRLAINPFKNIKVKHSYKKIEYLTEDELDKLYNLNINNKSLERVRDAFILQSYCGLAYCDLYNLKKDDIKIAEDGTHYISKQRQKTGSDFTTVILPRGVEVLQKYNYDLKILSNQKYNLLLKTVQGLADIDTKLTTHLARKTFCCLLLNRGVSINTVAKCAGHKDIKITRSYYATLQESTVISEVKQAFI
jgi:integrase